MRSAEEFGPEIYFFDFAYFFSPSSAPPRPVALPSPSSSAMVSPLRPHLTSTRTLHSCYIRVLAVDLALYRPLSLPLPLHLNLRVRFFQKLLSEYSPLKSPSFSSDLHTNQHRRVLDMAHRREEEEAKASTADATSCD
jgi:hypothetical protein